LSREADLVVVAPATADLIARMAAGMADDLAATTLLASDKPVLIAPAMNAQMWAHSATQTNLATLAARGVSQVGPGAGELACRERSGAAGRCRGHGGGGFRLAGRRHQRPETEKGRKGRAGAPPRRKSRHPGPHRRAP